MRTVAIVQARMESSRFPGKSLRKIRGRTLVELVHHRLSKSHFLDSVVFAIPDGPQDDVLFEHLQKIGAKVFRGSSDDVQDRFLRAAEQHNGELLVRITADCPLIDWRLVDDVISLYKREGVDYASNVCPPTYPDGLDVEVFSRDKLVEARVLSESPEAREHVTWAFRTSDNYVRANLVGREDMSDLRWTVDYQADLDALNRSLPERFMEFNWEELMEHGFKGIASAAKRNEGSGMSSGQKLWSRAKGVIPGGGMLLSKRSEMFLPEQWPSYFSRAKGFEVWDLDGTKFQDFALMGVGTSSLGYGDDFVDSEVKKAVSEGVMSSLNSPAEVYLAEKLIEIHSPWAGGVRFARSGGEANAIAVRIARALSGKDKVAICGYHGWHDWYLSANLGDDSALDGHLLPGLDPAGVPRSLRGTVVPFNFNDLGSLEALLSSGEFGVVKLEVERSEVPAEGFLAGVRDLCHKYGAVLIFDECTSGFRETFGGIHLRYGVEPDIAMFGKALGNGYAITAVVGRSEVMNAAQSTFISSTFWTERIGPVAALATLQRMVELQSWITNRESGFLVKTQWSTIFSALGIPHRIFGLDAMPTFVFELPTWNVVKTLITQGMLERGYLATNSFYPSIAHTTEAISTYLEALQEVLLNLGNLSDEGGLRRRLRGPEAHTGFRRLA